MGGIPVHRRFVSRTGKEDEENEPLFKDKPLIESAPMPKAHIEATGSLASRMAKLIDAEGSLPVGVIAKHLNASVEDVRIAIVTSDLFAINREQEVWLKKSGDLDAPD